MHIATCYTVHSYLQSPNAVGVSREGGAQQGRAPLIFEPDPENLAFTTTWGGKFPLYFSESHISWDVISAW